MTVQELIDQLNAVENKNLDVVVPEGYRTVNANCEVYIDENFEYCTSYGSVRKAVKIIIG